MIHMEVIQTPAQVEETHRKGFWHHIGQAAWHLEMLLQHAPNLREDEPYLRRALQDLEDLRYNPRGDHFDFAYQAAESLEALGKHIPSLKEEELYRRAQQHLADISQCPQEGFWGHIGHAARYLEALGKHIPSLKEEELYCKTQRTLKDICWFLQGQE